MACVALMTFFFTINYLFILLTILFIFFFIFLIIIILSLSKTFFYSLIKSNYFMLFRESYQWKGLSITNEVAIESYSRHRKKDFGGSRHRKEDIF